MTYKYGYTQCPEQGTRSSKAGITDFCDLPNMGAGTWAQVLLKSYKHDQPLNYLSNPRLDFFKGHLIICGPKVMEKKGFFLYCL